MRLLDYFIGLLYPRKCPFCTKIIDEKLLYCSSCAKKLPYIPNQLQPRSFKYVDEAYSVFYYKDEVRDSILRYKFSALSAYSQVYGQFLRKCIDENGISCDIICWVPLHKKRLRERGYDQAEIIARALSKKLGVPCQRLLVKESGNKRQSSIDNREERKANVPGVYRCVSKEELLGKRVLLVDDIITSGATVGECAAMLKAFGCTEIYAAAFAAVTS